MGTQKKVYFLHELCILSTEEEEIYLEEIFIYISCWFHPAPSEQP